MAGILWGIRFDTANFARPEQFRIQTKKDRETKEKTVWVFPSNWANYQNEALQTSILYALKGKTEVFSCGTTVREYLVRLKPHAANAPLPVINYGVNAFSIFGISPDDYLIDALSDSLGDYLTNHEEVIRLLGFGAELASETVELLDSL